MQYIVDGDIVLSQPPTGPVAHRLMEFARWARDHGYARCSRYRQVLLPRVLADGSDNRASASDGSPPSTRLGISDGAFAASRFTAVMPPRRWLTFRAADWSNFRAAQPAA